MRRTLRYSFGVNLLLGALMSSASAMANTGYVQCPATVQLTVSTGVDGWQAVNTEQRISRTEIVNGANNTQMLRCIYDGGAMVQQRGDINATCAVHDRTGFVCQGSGGGRSSSSGGASVHYSNTTVIAPGVQIDLDGTNGSPWNNDLWVKGSTERDLALAPFADAQMSAPQARAMGYDLCTKATYGTTEVLLRQLRQGDHLCLRTNEGRVAAVRIDQVSVQGSSLGVRVTHASYE